METETETAARETETTYEIVVSRARMPNSCWGSYVRIGVLEMRAGAPSPAMISIRARGCVRVVETWERLREGRTERCAAARALAEARALVARLLSERGVR